MTVALDPISASIIGAIEEHREYDWTRKARPEQIPPGGAWSKCLMMSGRGAGKTRSGAEWLRMQVQQGARRVALVAATAADARDVMVEGESGILAVSPPSERPLYEPSKRRLTWPNGAVGTLYSAEEPDRLRGPQHGVGWCDELASWSDANKGDALGTAWNNLLLGLRLGEHPRVLATTTPRNNRLLRELVADPLVPVMRGSTYDNLGNLAPTFRAEILATYEGTRIGRQELEGELLLDVPGALWALAQMDELRVSEAPAMARIVVAVDPSGGSTEGHDEQGIIVCGKGIDGLGYVLADYSCRLSPDGWGRRAVSAYLDHQADRLLWEANFGGDMAVAVIEAAARNMGVTVATHKVTATRGKRLRAEPIAAMYEQHRIRHAGSFPELEEQMTTYTADATDASPDRLDAMVMALAELMGGAIRADAAGLAGLNQGLGQSAGGLRGLDRVPSGAWSSPARGLPEIATPTAPRLRRGGAREHLPASMRGMPQ